MSTLRASATEFVPSFGNASEDQRLQSAQTQQHDQTRQQQVQNTDPAEQQQSHSEQDYGYEDGFYDENGNWVSYGDDEGADDEMQQQEWPEQYDWPPYDDQQLQQLNGQRWQGIDWQQDQQQQQELCAQGLHQQSAGQQQQKASSIAAAAADGIDDSSWNDVSISSAQAGQLLHSWYPNQSLAMLTQLLEACEGRLQDALQLLSEMEHEAQQAMKQQQQSAAAAHRHAAEPDDATAAGRTGWGFAAAATAKQQQHRDFNLREELFPDLPTAAPEGKQQQQTVPLWDNPAVGHASSSSSNWSAVATKAAAVTSAATQGRNNPIGMRRSSTARQAPSSGNGNSVRVGANSTDAAAAVPWVETGAAVSQEYAAARAEASDYARVRNACFHQATIAYLAGDKALAKELSAKGKQAAQQMWKAHERASQQIFTQRNAKLAAAAASCRPGGSSSSASSSTPGVIDLHGLHVNEVKAMLPQQLAKLAKQQQQHVSLIVGTGHHTKGPPSARVGPAVEALLQELGYKHRQVQPGLLRCSCSNALRFKHVTGLGMQ